MADMNLTDSLEAVAGDEPTPAAIDRIWRHLEAELLGFERLIEAGDDVTELTLLTAATVSAHRRKRLWLVGAAAVALMLLGLAIAVPRFGSGGSQIVTPAGDSVDDTVSGSVPPSPTSVESTPESPPPIDDAFVEPGPLETFLSVYLRNGIEAAVATGLVPQPVLDYQTVDWGPTLIDELTLIEGQEPMTLECEEGAFNEKCILSFDGPFSDALSRSDRLAITVSAVDREITGMSLFVLNNGTARRAYEEWLSANDPDRLDDACRIGQGYRCFYEPANVLAYTESDSFDTFEFPVD